MNVLVILIPLALMLSIGFMVAFFWATADGQWDDLDLAPRRTLDEPLSREETHDASD